MKNEEVVIVAAKRTPIGSYLGGLSSLSAPELGSIAHRAALEEANLTGADLDEVISGCVLQAGIGQAPARQAAIAANIPNCVGATTINKMCGSGLKSVMLGVNAIKTGESNIVLASGMESMSNAPYLLAKARKGYRMGHDVLIDSMLYDGLEDAYARGQAMGVFADQTAEYFGFSREAQDEFALRSLTLALDAIKSGAFSDEIVPIHIIDKKGTQIIDRDESPDATKIEKIPRLKPVFSPTGTVTAANSSSISDGAASVILMSESMALKRNCMPIARIVAQATHAQAPEWFTTAPVDAINKVLQKAEWNIQDVDLFEINEAFAVVALTAIQQLNLDINRVNVHGGACALGHPIGASGTRVLVTLINALKQHKKQKGIAALCIGGGEAVAVAIELL